MSGLCRVILILLVITAELFINNTLKALLCHIFPNNCRVHFRCQTGVLGEYVARHPVVKSPLQHAEVWLYVNVIGIIYAVCYECVMNVLWMLWMCCGCVMDVLWICYVLWMCYGCVMDLLWMCYGCVMDVLWIINVLKMYVWWVKDGYFISTVLDVL